MQRWRKTWRRTRRQRSKCPIKTKIKKSRRRIRRPKNSTKLQIRRKASSLICRLRLTKSWKLSDLKTSGFESVELSTTLIWISFPSSTLSSPDSLRTSWRLRLSGSSDYGDSKGSDHASRWRKNLTFSVCWTSAEIQPDTFHRKSMWQSGPLSLNCPILMNSWTCPILLRTSKKLTKSERHSSDLRPKLSIQSSW